MALESCFCLKLRTVISVRFPITGGRNPSYPIPSRLMAVTLLLELSTGVEHKIPRNSSPELSHGSILKSQVLINKYGGTELGSIDAVKERRTSASDSRVLE